jgi:hypothetical protein
VISCTTSFEIFQREQFLGTKGPRTLFSIGCQNGKSIAAHSYFTDTEQEVILMPGSYFEVVSQSHPLKDLHIIHLKEIQSLFPFITPPFDKSLSLTPIQKPMRIVTPNGLFYFIQYYVYHS